MSSASSEVAIEEHHHVSGVKEIELLKAKEDWFGGLTVVINEHMEAVDFVPQLRYSISKWKAQGKKGLWIKLSISHSNLVDSVVKEGFRFHHAESDYVMLVRWLPDDAPDTLPPNASHRVGIGAFVINESKEVLVVMERSGGFRDTKYWKLPTGVVEEGEDICAAAVREVKEETGIDVEFVEILAFRQSHRCFFSKSDLFFVCMMRPVSSIMITIQASEIEASKWIPIEEYVEQPFNKKHGQFGYVAEICKAKAEGGGGGGGYAVTQVCPIAF
ncbi:Nudix hydrolase 2 [Linum perenne]